MAFLDAQISEGYPDDEMPFTYEEASVRLSRILYQNCKHQSVRSLVLSRVFQSMPYADLPRELAEAAHQATVVQPKPGDHFLVLLGTVGDEEPWCDRKRSRGHKVIPLDQESVKKIPMLSRALQQLDVDLKIFMGPEREKGLSVEGIGGHISAFHVEKAPGSPYIPDQESFVVPHEVKSVLGSGARLPGGQISIFVGFSRHEISRESANTFAPAMVLFWQRLHPVVEKLFSWTRWHPPA